MRLGLAGALSGVLTARRRASTDIASWRGLRAANRRPSRRSDCTRGPPISVFPAASTRRSFSAAARIYARANRRLGGARSPRATRSAARPREGEDFSAPPLSRWRRAAALHPGTAGQYFTPEALAAFARRALDASAPTATAWACASPVRASPIGQAARTSVSDGVTPGAIQVPGDGQPIVLRADGQTSGGYAKIGCVISADLDRMAHFCRARRSRFVAVDHEQAARARASDAKLRRSLRDAVAFRRKKLERESGQRPLGRRQTLWSENLDRRRDFPAIGTP